MGVGFQEGVYAAGSYEVVQRAAGANMSVDVNANVHENGIGALVQGDTVVGQGLYVVPPHSAVINETISAAHATLPRVDIVVLEIQDNVHDATGGNLARTRVIAGTATSGATLDNRTGAPALPANCLLLADVHIPATDTTIANSQIRDRRKWARGFNSTVEPSDISAAPGTGTWADIGTATRVECSGIPLRASVTAIVGHVTSGAQISLRFLFDGAAFDGITANHDVRVIDNTQNYHHSIDRRIAAPPAGSHLVLPQYKPNVASTTVVNNIEVVLEESVRQNTANNTTTSG